MTSVRDIIEKLIRERSLSVEEYTALVKGYSKENAALLSKEAVKVRESIYKRGVFIRGLIEISSFCKNDCLYCGLRRSNRLCERYRLTKKDILECCEEGYSLGFRTFVLQGGEDPYFTDEWLCPLIKEIKALYPDAAITLSLGERSEESYEKLFDAGADRYLLRHESADENHYSRLHPKEMTLQTRMEALFTLRRIGFQVGCGFMVGSPFQEAEHIAEDLKFIETFKPDMCGIGPFIPHKDTPFAEYPAGSADMTCYLLSIVRIICPTVLLPATTALGSIEGDGREKGILAGANVVMPNLSPASVRKKYSLYNGKISDGAESAQSKAELERRMMSIGYSVEISRGDPGKEDI